MAHKFFSQRAGLSPHPRGLPFDEVMELFVRVYNSLTNGGYFAEAFGYGCVDAGWIDGTIGDIGLDIRLATRKANLWPIETLAFMGGEDDLFDFIEYLYQNVSKPTKGILHSFNDCGMHWSEFDKSVGQREFREKINALLSQYERRFELAESGEILMLPDHGFEEIFKAKIPSTQANVISRTEAAVLRFRRHGSTRDDRRQAVRDLADVLEALRPQMTAAITGKDEGDLFNIANNFGIRHNNDRQKTDYDAVWLSWMFYFYLSTIHVILRRIEPSKNAAAKSPRQ